MSVKGNNIIESNGKNEVATSFVVTSVSLSNTQGNEGASEERYTASVETGGQTHILSMYRLKTADGTLSAWTLESDGFKDSAKYLAAKSIKKVVVQGLDVLPEGLVKDKDALKDGLVTFVKKSYPTVAKIDFNGLAVLDYKANQLTLGFTLDNKAKSQISVLYNMSDQTFVIN